MTTYTIEVTQDDINQGQRDRCRKCPIALAMQRAFTRNDISVYGTCTWIGNDHYSDLPIKAQDFIDFFDRGETVEPFSFELTFRGLND